jgi:hypothetical protein
VSTALSSPCVSETSRPPRRSNGWVWGVYVGVTCSLPPPASNLRNSQSTGADILRMLPAHNEDFTVLNAGGCVKAYVGDVNTSRTPEEGSHSPSWLNGHIIITIITWEHSGNVQGTFREHSTHSGNIQGSFAARSGNIAHFQGTFREHSGSIQGTFRKRSAYHRPHHIRTLNPKTLKP